MLNEILADTEDQHVIGVRDWSSRARTAKTLAKRGLVEFSIASAEYHAVKLTALGAQTIATINARPRREPRY